MKNKRLSKKILIALLCGAFLAFVLGVDYKYFADDDAGTVATIETLDESLADNSVTDDGNSIADSEEPTEVITEEITEESTEVTEASEETTEAGDITDEENNAINFIIDDEPIEESSEEPTEEVEFSEDVQQLNEVTEDTIENEEGEDVIINSALYNISSNYTLDEVNQLDKNSVRYQMIQYALKFLGNPYVWGGTSLTNGTDCSGFTLSVYKNFGYTIPRTAAAQHSFVKPVEKDKLQPGDFVFFKDRNGNVGHVALYMGDDQIIHASSSKVGIIVSNINYREACAYGTLIEEDAELGELDLSDYEEETFTSDVNSITYCFAKPNADLSVYYVEEITDNDTLAKAIYYAYGSMGYNYHRVDLEQLYLSWGCEEPIDKTEETLSILGSIYNNKQTEHAKQYLDMISGYGKPSSSFIPYYVWDIKDDFTGVSFLSKKGYEVSTLSQEEESFLSAVADAVEEGTLAVDGDTVVEVEPGTLEQCQNFHAKGLSLETDTGDLLKSAGGFSVGSVNSPTIDGVISSNYKINYNGTYVGTGYCFDHRARTETVGNALTQYMNAEILSAFPNLNRDSNLDANIGMKRLSAMVKIFFESPLFSENGTHITESKAVAGLALSYLHLGDAGLSSNSSVNTQAKSVAAIAMNGASAYPLSCTVPDSPTIADNNQVVTSTIIKNGKTYYISKPMKITDLGTNSVDGSNIMYYGYVPNTVSDAAGNIFGVDSGVVISVDNDINAIKNVFKNNIVNNENYNYKPHTNTDRLMLENNKYITFIWCAKDISGASTEGKEFSMQFANFTPIYDAIAYKPNNYQPGKDKQPVFLAGQQTRLFTLTAAGGPSVKYGYTYFKKTSANPSCTNGNACYSLANAKYIIKTKSGAWGKIVIAEPENEDPVYATIVPNKPFITNEKGEFTYTFTYTGNKQDVYNVYPNAVKDGTSYTVTFSGNVVAKMETGDYILYETKASKGYQIDEACFYVNDQNRSSGHAFTVSESNTRTNPKKVTCKEPPMLDPLKLSMVKYDLETQTTVALGGGKLSGAVFEVAYYDGYYKKSNLPASATRKWYFETDDNGKWNYWNSPAASGYTSSSFYSDENGRQIPLGTVTVKEVKAPTGYYTTTGNALTNGSISLDDNAYWTNEMAIFQIKADDSPAGSSLYSVGQDGSVTVTSGSMQVAVGMSDPVKRGDLSFTKSRYEDASNMKHIAFILKNIDSGEKHIVVTDDNGYYSTKGGLVVDGNTIDAFDYTSNVNGNDRYLNNLTHPNVLENNLRPTPVWFYGTASADKQDKDNINNPEGSGALPYGKYSLTEIKSNGNSGTQLIADGECIFEVTPEDDGTPFFLQEALTDMPTPKIKTMSLDAQLLSHYSMPQKNVTINDKVSYEFLQFNQKYTMKGILVAREDFTTTEGVVYKKGQPIKDDNGKYIMSHITFQTEQKENNQYNRNASGTVTLTYTFDAETLKGTKGVWSTFLCEEDDTDLILKEDGSVDLQASKVVRFEAGSDADIYIYDNNPYNEDEWVTFSGVETDAFTSAYEINTTQPGPNTVIKDIVYLTNLIEDQEYELESLLVNPENGQVIKDKSGNDCITTTPFTYREDPETHNMKLIVKLPTFDSTPFAGKSVVVFERVKYNGRLIIADESLVNTRETVYFPTIETTAHGDEGNKLIPLTGIVKIVDTVEYNGLAPDHEYTITGTLHYKDEDGNEQPLKKKDGSYITASKTITVTEPNGSVDITFEFNVNDVAGEFPSQVTVFEDVYYNDLILCTHADINDEGQTVELPVLKTSLKDGSTGEQVISDFSGEITLTDTVNYSALDTSQKYTLVGKLINKLDGTILKNKDGKEITSFVSFQPTSKNGSQDVTFTFDADSIEIPEDEAVAQIVCYEYLYSEFDPTTASLVETQDGYIDIYQNVTLWSVHNDISDVNQTVSTVSGHTEMTDANTGDHQSAAVDDMVTLKDVIYYEGLIVGKAYTVTGTLYTDIAHATEEELKYRTTDDNGVECCPVLDNGKPIQTTIVFVAPKTKGTIEVEFQFHRSVLDAKPEKDRIVAFEEVTPEDSERPVFTHRDINDEAQTVSFPKVHTTALSEDTHEHMVGDYKTAKIIDTVAYENVVAGETYKIIGKLMDQASGQPVQIEGDEIEVEGKPFKAESTSGTYDMIFEFDATYMAGHTVVVYEKLYHKTENGDWVVVGVHEDIDDEGQSVHVTDLHTQAMGRDTGTQQVNPDEKVTIVDTVKYSNLLVGKTYTVKGMLMLVPEDGNSVNIFDRLTGNTAQEGDQTYTLSEQLCTYDADRNVYVDQNGYECNALLVDGKPVTAEATFVAEQPNGTVQLEFTFNASALAGRTIVVFEDLYNEEYLVGVHADITDQDQTIEFPPGNPPPKTSDNYPLPKMIIIAVALLLGIGVTIFIKRRRR